MKPLHDNPLQLGRRRGQKFGYPDMNPATLLFLTQELRRARTKAPSNEKNFDLIQHYRDQLKIELARYADGKSNAITVQMTALQIAVMAIRVSEEGIAGHPYKGNAPTLPGPLGEHLEKQMASVIGHPVAGYHGDGRNPDLDALTVKVTRK